MAQISKGDTFVDGQQVTGARLNQLVDASTLLVGAITDQPSITANTLQSTDSTIVNDAGVLKEATIGDFLNSNLPITTSAVSAGASSDLTVTPNDAGIVSSVSYSSGDGITVTVNSTAHTLSVGQVILVTLAGTGYNGTFQVATTATNSFTYVMTTAATAGSGTLSYTKKGSVRTVGNQTVTGNVFVAGSSNLVDVISTGTANFTGALQVNGSTGYVLTEIVEQTMTPWNAPSVGNHDSLWTSSSFTKPSDEIWVFELSYHYFGAAGYGFNFGFRYSNQTVYSGTYKVVQNHSAGVASNAIVYSRTDRWVEPVGVSLTSLTLKADGYANTNSQFSMFNTATGGTTTFIGFTTTNVAPSVFRIYKYKTA